MHSFHPSRARIFFDIFCALTIGVSCAIAWLQTGASAFLAIAGITAVYSLVRATDAGRRTFQVAAAVPAFEPEEEQGDLLLYVASAEAETVVEEAPKPTKAKRRSRKKQPEPEVAPEVEVAEPGVVAEVVLVEPEEMTPVFDEPAAIEPEEDHHAVVTPLFEPQPMVRQQRTVFGRKAG